MKNLTKIYKHKKRKHPNREGLDISRNNESRINMDSEPLISNQEFEISLKTCNVLKRIQVINAM